MWFRKLYSKIYHHFYFESYHNQYATLCGLWIDACYGTAVIKEETDNLKNGRHCKTCEKILAKRSK
jgi:hypothetical protein